MTALRDLLARSTPASHRNETGADDAPKPLTKAEEKELRRLQRAWACCMATFKEVERCQSLERRDAAAKARGVRTRKHLLSSVSNPKE